MCRPGAGPGSVSREAGRAAGRGGRAAGRRRAGGRCAQSEQLPPDSFGAAAPAPATPSAPLPPPGRFPRVGGRRCAGAAASPQAPVSAAVAGKCCRAGSRRLKPTCAAEPRRLTAEPARAAARAPPRGRDFDFKERKEGRKDNSQLPLPPSCSGGRAGPCPGRRRPRPGRRDFPGGPATRSADCEFVAHGSWFLQALREAERHSPSPRREEPPASPGPRALPAPPPARVLRPRRWMA